MRSKVLANERRRYIHNVLSHWLRPCTAWSKPGSAYLLFQIASSLNPTEVKPGVAIATITGELVGRDNKYTLQVNRVGLGGILWWTTLWVQKEVTSRWYICIIYVAQKSRHESFPNFFLISRIFRNPEIITNFPEFSQSKQKYSKHCIMILKFSWFVWKSYSHAWQR